MQMELFEHAELLSTLVTAIAIQIPRRLLDDIGVKYMVVMW